MRTSAVTDSCAVLHQSSLAFVIDLDQRVGAAGFVPDLRPAGSRRALRRPLRVPTRTRAMRLAIGLVLERLGAAKEKVAAAGIAVAVILLIEIFLTIGRFEAARQTFPSLSESTTDDVRSIGAALFRNYNLPFQIVGVLVLVATIGVVLLSKREPR